MALSRSPPPQEITIIICLHKVTAAEFVGILSREEGSGASLDTHLSHQLVLFAICPGCQWPLWSLVGLEYVGWGRRWEQLDSIGCYREASSCRWVKTFQCGSSGTHILLSVTPHPPSLSRPSKLIGCAGWTLVELNLSLSLGRLWVGDRYWLVPPMEEIPVVHGKPQNTLLKQLPIIGNESGDTFVQIDRKGALEARAFRS